MIKIKDKTKKVFFKYFGKINKLKLQNRNFTIISNNCFGGIIYRNNHLKYLSPTCGMAMMADDYIKFIYNMDYYLKFNEIEEINVIDSKYYDYFKKIKYDGLLGKIDDLELMLIHYKNIEEAKEKWNRRKKRINKDNIIYKFNDQNLCSYEDLKKFYEFPAKNKICFTAKKYDEFNFIQLKQFEKYEYVISDVNERDYKKYINIYKYINEIKDKNNE